MSSTAVPARVGCNVHPCGRVEVIVASSLDDLSSLSVIMTTRDALVSSELLAGPGYLHIVRGSDRLCFAASWTDQVKDPQAARLALQDLGLFEFPADEAKTALDLA